MDKLIIYFTIYSFLGWICEVIYCGAIDRKFVNRGFLFGPVCPVYGFGALFVLFLLNRFIGQPILLFILAFIITSIIEYITSYILEKTFQIKLWDYSKHKININGRVCLLNSTLFGLLSLVLVEWVNPFITKLLNKIEPSYLPLVASFLALVFIVDFICTIISVLKLKGKLDKLFVVEKEFSNLNVKIQKYTFNEINKALSEVKVKKDSTNNKRINKISKHIDSVTDNVIISKRILKAFPGMKYRNERRHIGRLIELLEDIDNKRIM